MYDGCPSVRLKTEALRALFPDDDCILVGKGAMSTPALWDAFALNPCHLGEDGTITRYGQVIGSRQDIEIEGVDF